MYKDFGWWKRLKLRLLKITIREVCMAYYMQHIGNISDDRFFPLGSWVVGWGWGKFWLAVAKVEKGQLCLDNAFKSRHVLRELLLSKCASFIIYCTHFWMNTNAHSLDHWIPFLAGINVLFLTYAFCSLPELCSFDQFFWKPIAD